MKMFFNVIFMSKLQYGTEAWSAAPAYIIKKLVSIQLEAARTMLRPQTRRWTATHLLTEMKWLSIPLIAQLASAKLTHKILTTSQPAVLANRILSKINHTQITRTNGLFKLGPKPSRLGNSKFTKYQYNAYYIYDKIPQVLREIKKPKIFKNRLKQYL